MPFSTLLVVLVENNRRRGPDRVQIFRLKFFWKNFFQITLCEGQKEKGVANILAIKSGRGVR